MMREFGKRAGRVADALERLSIQKRLIITYLLIILIPSAMISVYIFNDFYEKTIQDMTDEYETALKAELVHIRNQIETMERTAQLAISTGGVMSYLGLERDLTAAELMDVDAGTVSGIERLQYNNPEIDHIYIFSDNPHMHEISPVFYKERRAAAMPWYAAFAGSAEPAGWVLSHTNPEMIVIGDPPPPQREAPKISLLRAIRDAAAERVGMIQIDMLLRHFAPNLFAGERNGLAQMFLADESGGLYTDPGSGFYASTGLTPEALIRQSAALSASGSASAEFRFQNDPYLYIFTDVPQIGARLFYVVSLKPVLSDISETRNVIIAANVLLIAVLAAVTSFSNALILKKLRLLSSSMKKVRNGDFNIDLNIRGGGEVGELVFHFQRMMRQINELIADAVNKRAANKEAELKALRNQIDSHFLYNTLENIKMMAETEGQYPISDALTALGVLMRYNLNWSSEYARLRDEISYIKNYVSVMNVRFDQRIRLSADVPAAYSDQELLKMSLQPIVENAIKHGAGTKFVNGLELTVAIQAFIDQEFMHIVVADDGEGMAAEAIEELNRKISMSEEEFRLRYGPAGGFGTESRGGGVGLRNVHQRIQLYYGKDCGIAVEGREKQYTRVTIKIPHMILSAGGTEHAKPDDRR